MHIRSHSIGKSGLTAAATAIAATVGLLAGAAPASAGPNCANGNHCVFYLGINDSSRHSYFDSDSNFSGDTFDQLNPRAGEDQSVNDNVVSASNSSTGGYESHYYEHSGYSGFLFCVNPGSSVDYLPGDLWDRASSLRLRGTTTINCY